MADIHEFKSWFPQFACADEDDIQKWLDQFPLRFTPSRFGTQATMAAYLYAAHQLSTYPSGAGFGGRNVSAVTGGITSDKVGDLSRSYGSVVDLADVPRSLRGYTSTRYGIDLIGIILSRRHAFPMVVKTGSTI